MQRTRLSASLILLLVFASGALVGAFSHRLYTMNSVSASSGRKSMEEYRRKYVAEVRGRLALSQDQVSKLERILDEVGKEFKELHERSKPEVRAIQARQVEMIRGILNEGQVPEYEKMLEERRKERERRKRQK